jgi:hypothetical protein
MTKWHLVLVPWPSTKYIIREKVVASPKFSLWWVLWVRFCSWFVIAPKCFDYTLTNLLFSLCKFVWVSDCLSFFLVPSQSSSTPLYPQSVASQGACPNSLCFRCFHIIFTFESIKELGSASHMHLLEFMFWSMSNDEVQCCYWND